MSNRRPNYTLAQPVLVAALAMSLAVAACGSAATPSSTSVASPAPIPTSVASSAPIPSATPSPAATVVPSVVTATGPIADGTYRTEPVPISAVLAHIEADKTLSTAEKAGFESGFKGHKTEIIELKLEGGLFTESDAFDGASFEVGAHATYAFPDDRTLVIQEQCCGLSTFTIKAVPNGFALAYTAGAANAGEDVVGQTVYESAPFLRVP